MSLKFKRNYHLEKLDKLMSTEASSKTPSIAYLNPDGVARAWILISAISTPYLLWLLFRLQKFGWLVSFAVFVLTPFLVNYFLINDPNASLLFWAVTLIDWVVFLFLLKNSYNTWREPDFKNTQGSDFR
jgi:hypothetical protein